MRSRKLPGLPVFTIDRGTEIGRVHQPLVDPDQRRVFALVVSIRRFLRKFLLSVDDVHAFGNHAVTVRSKDVLRPMKAPGDLGPLLRAENIPVLGSGVITEKGNWVGAVKDYEMDGNGKIVTIYVTDGIWRNLSGKEAAIDGDMMIALGPDAIITADDALSVAEKQLGQQEDDDPPGDRRQDIPTIKLKDDPKDGGVRILRAPPLRGVSQLRDD